MKTVAEAIRDGWSVAQAQLAHDPRVALMKKQFPDGLYRFAFAAYFLERAQVGRQSNEGRD